MLKKKIFLWLLCACIGHPVAVFANDDKTKAEAVSGCTVCKSNFNGSVYEIDVRPGYAENTVKLDGNSPNRQAKTFKKSDRVRIILINMNPFLYEYTVKINATPVVEEAIPYFFSFFSKNLKDWIGTTSSSVQSAFSGGGAGAVGGRNVGLLKSVPVLPEGCDADMKAAKEAFTYLVERREALMSEEGSIETRYATLLTAFQNAATAYVTAQKQVQDTLIESQALCEALNKAEQELAKLETEQCSGKKFVAELDSLRQAIQAAQDIRAEIAAGVTEFTASYPRCTPKTQGFKYLDALAQYATAVNNRMTARTATLAKMEEKAREFAGLRQAIAYVTTHQEVLMRKAFEIGGYDTSTNVAITVERRATALLKQDTPQDQAFTSTRELDFLADTSSATHNLTAVANAPANASSQATSNTQSSTPHKQAELKFGGGPRFSVSAGVLVTTLGSREFQPALGIARDRNGQPTNNDTITNVVGFKENISRRVSPLLMLNTRIWQGAGYGLHGSFGVTGKKDSTETAVEYFLGPSLSFLENRLFLTVGPFIGKQQRLAGDLFQSAPLASGTTTIPVRSEYQVKLGVSFTYKIK